MATTISAMKSRIGDTEYYLGTVAAGELIDSVGYAQEITDWDELDIEEQMQRKLSELRVRKEIVPYLQHDPDRFFGALLVLVYQGWEDLDFEGLGEVAKLPKRYAQEADRFGFLHLPGKRRLIALDGQHRLKALEIAIKGDEKNGIDPMPELSEDSISVIFIKNEDPTKTRNIFNKTNRYAKPTSRADNLITAEDDAIAILTRRLISPRTEPRAPLAGNLVNVMSNTLSVGSKHFTTMSTVAETVEIVLEDEIARKEIKKQQRPSDDELDEYYEKVERVWSTVLQEVEELRGIGDPEYVKELRKKSLLFKPAGQMALFRGLKRAMDAGMLLEEAAEAVNRIQWDISNPSWRGVIMKSGGRIDTGKEAKNLAGRLIAHQITGGRIEDPDLENDYNRRVENQEGEKGTGLPDLEAEARLSL